MKYLFIILSVLVFLSLKTCESKLVIAKKPMEQNCLNYLVNTTHEISRCEFYKCFEERFPCGSGNYVMNLGYKYCRRYSEEDTFKQFTKAGQDLTNHLVYCLPRAFEKIYKTKKAIRCGQLNKDGYKAQEECYIEVLDSFCNGLQENKNVYGKKMDLMDVISPDGIAIMRRMAERCGKKIDVLQLVLAFGGK